MKIEWTLTGRNRRIKRNGKMKNAKKHEKEMRKLKTQVNGRNEHNREWNNEKKNETEMHTWHNTEHEEHENKPKEMKGKWKMKNMRWTNNGNPKNAKNNKKKYGNK